MWSVLKSTDTLSFPSSGSGGAAWSGSLGSSSGCSSFPSSALRGCAEDMMGRDNGRLELINMRFTGVPLDASFLVQSGHGRPEHLARLTVEGLAAVALFQVALQFTQAGAVHVLVLQRVLHVFQEREVGRLHATRFSR